MSSADSGDRTATGGRPKVVMMVGNDISHDTRVLKEGLSLADAGVDVTLLGLGSRGVREEARLGEVRILRVPVEWRLRDGVAARRKRRRTPKPRLAQSTADRRLADLRATLRAGDAELGGLPRRSRAGVAQGLTEVARIRAGLDRRLQRAVTKGWKAYDGVVHRTPVGAQWRRVLPEIDDYELAFGPVLDRLDWEVLHAHDVHLVGIAARAVARRRAEGRPAAWVYDAHEFVSGLSIYGPRTRRRRAAYYDLESEYFGMADAVVTVTDELAEELVRQYRMKTTPTVVMNSPVLAAATKPLERTIRDDCGLEPGVPLMVYSGGVTAVRGIDTAVRALPLLPEAHLAVVCVPNRDIPAARTLAQLASTLGVGDRLHLLDPVNPDLVSSYVATADIGIIPILRFPSHEVALANKLFEYLYAGVPVLVSDLRAQRSFVERYDVGGVHAVGDPESFAEAFRAVLARHDDIRATIAGHPDLLTPYAWERQAKTLRGLYRSLLGADRVREPEEESELDDLVEVPAVRTDRPSVLGIGPANMAGQAWEWAKAVEREVPGVTTEVVVVDRGGPLQYPADVRVPAETYAKDASWAAALEARVLDSWTHVLLEAGRPLFGLRHGRDFSGDVPVLRAVGVHVGLLFHGSEIRNPRRHAESTPWSPFRDPDEALTARLQSQWDVLHPLVEAFDGPTFVSTPDLLDDVEGAHWLPVVVDVARWATDAPVLERDVPVVLHAPSRASIKGTAHVDAAIQPLADAGLVEYRRLEGIAPEMMPAAVADADLVLDQFSLGSYGVMAVQAMAAGRVVLGHVTETVRERCPEPLPIVEATPDALAEVVRKLVEDRDAARAVAAAGAAYAASVHDGRRSAGVLEKVLGLRGE